MGSISHGQLNTLADTLSSVTKGQSPSSTSAVETTTSLAPSLIDQVPDIVADQVMDLSGGVSSAFSASPGGAMENFLFDSAPFDNISAGGISASPHAIAGFMPALYFAGVALMKANSKDAYYINTGDSFKDNSFDKMTTEDPSGVPDQYQTYRNLWDPDGEWTDHGKDVPTGNESMPHDSPDFELEVGNQDYDQGLEQFAGQKKVERQRGVETPFGVIRATSMLMDTVKLLDDTLAGRMTPDQIEKVREGLNGTRMVTGKFKASDAAQAAKMTTEMLIARRDRILTLAGMDIPTATADNGTPTGGSQAVDMISGLNLTRG